jgi:hypothetical protein
VTIALDAVSNNDDDLLTWEHTPSGTPKGVLVLITQGLNSDDQISGVTYGGDAMTEMSGSPNRLISGELGVTYAYFRGSSVKTGAQNVVITETNTSPKDAICVTFTASGDTEVVDSDASINSNSITDPRATLSLGGGDCFCAIAFFSGAASLRTALTNWTIRHEKDRGSQVRGLHTYDVIGSTDVSAGWDQTDEDACAMAVAIKDSGAAVTLEQEGYRWRDDDANEATAAWLAAQDIDFAALKNANIRLRVIVNATGDPATKQYQLEWRKVGGSTWMPLEP